MSLNKWEEVGRILPRNKRQFDECKVVLSVQTHSCCDAV